MAIEWVPGAGGYVDSSTGKVVSTTPQTDSSGKTKVKVTSNSSSATTSSKPLLNKVTSAISSVGNTLNKLKSGGSTTMENAPTIESILGTANKKGSNTNANPMQTQAGSMATLNNNTEKAQVSPLQTTVTQTIPATDPYTEWINQYNEHLAQNNLQGQVDDLIQLNKMGVKSVNGRKVNDLLEEVMTDPATGEYSFPQDRVSQPIDTSASAAGISLITGKPLIDPNSEQANNIKQRLQAIDNRTVSSYQKRINNALLDGDYEKAEALQGELDQFYATTGISPVASEPVEIPETPEELFEQEMQQLDEKYDNLYKDLQLNYQQMYASALNDVTNGIIAQVGNLMNFQYDPTKDRALHIAQGYAQGKVKETMNATGMYYSSMTQNAITKAVAELVPVYEKMAREEIQENLQTLYNLGNYLMNLEAQQFNMWKTQVEFKFEELNQKRKDISQAWERAENLGYIDNQASAILGIPAGTLTYKARKDAQDRQDMLDMKERDYEQQEAMAKLNNDLQMQRIQEEARLDMEKLREQFSLQEKLNANNDYRDYTYKSQLQREAANVSGDGTKTYSTGTMTASQMESYYYNLVDNVGYSNEEAIDAALNNGKNDSERKNFLASIGEDPKKWLSGSQDNTPELDTSDRKKKFPTISEITRNTVVSDDVLQKLTDYYANDNSVAGLIALINGMQAETSERDDIGAVLDDVIIRNQNQGFNKALNEYTSKFSDDYGDSTKALTSSLNLINNYMSTLKQLGVDDDIRGAYGKSMYYSLIDKVANASKIDMSWGDTNDVTKDLKFKAGQQIASTLITPSDESLVARKDSILSYIDTKLPRYEEPSNTKTPSGQKIYVDDTSKIKWGVGTGNYIIDDDGVIRYVSKEPDRVGYTGRYYYYSTSTPSASKTSTNTTTSSTKTSTTKSSTPKTTATSILNNSGTIFNGAASSAKQAAAEKLKNNH